MDISKLQNGSCAQQEDGLLFPVIIPSSVTSEAVLFAENQLFDTVVTYEKETDKKNSKKFTSVKVSNGTTSGKEEYHYPCKGSAAELELGGGATCCNKKAKKWCCHLTVAVTLLTIIGFFTLPIIFFYVDVPENDDFSQSKGENLTHLLELCLALVSYVAYSDITMDN